MCTCKFDPMWGWVELQLSVLEYYLPPLRKGASYDGDERSVIEYRVFKMKRSHRIPVYYIE